jgi:hypothetical protein
VSDFGALNNTMASTPELSHIFVEAMEDYHQLSSDEKARISQLFFQCFLLHSLNRTEVGFENGHEHAAGLFGMFR